MYSCPYTVENLDIYHWTSLTARISESEITESVKAAVLLA